MKLLSLLTPAETILVRDCGDAQLKNLLKFTLMDLLLKKVIQIVEIEKSPHPRDDVRTYTYVKSGKNFSIYKPKKHELIFTSPFEKEESIEILFKNYIRMIYDSSGGKKSYRENIRSSKDMKDYFNQSFFIYLFRLIKLTEEGKKVKQKIAAYLNEVDKVINDLLENDQQKALELLIAIGGNIFLLRNLNFDLLKQIDKQLIKQQKTLYTDSDNYDDSVFFYTDFYDDDYLFDNELEDNDSFDSFFNDTIDSFDSEFDASSCSSCDSGCSSCGGCGGCD